LFKKHFDNFQVSHIQDESYSISFHEASFKWSENSADTTILKDITFSVKIGSLVSKAFFSGKKGKKI